MPHAARECADGALGERCKPGTLEQRSNARLEFSVGNAMQTGGETQILDDRQLGRKSVLLHKQRSTSDRHVSDMAATHAATNHDLLGSAPFGKTEEAAGDCRELVGILLDGAMDDPGSRLLTAREVLFEFGFTDLVGALLAKRISPTSRHLLAPVLAHDLGNLAARESLAFNERRGNGRASLPGGTADVTGRTVLRIRGADPIHDHGPSCHRAPGRS